MLSSIRRWFLRARLEAGFIKSEWTAYRRHFEDAAFQFDTSQFESDIQRAEASVIKVVEAKFGSSVAKALSDERIAETALGKAQRVLQLVQRDFKSELTPLYDQLTEIKAQLSKAYDEKSAAHDRHNSAKSSLESWHAKSDRYLFGNKGRQLPKRAFFGQDLSDRDYYKRQRDSAATDIGSAKEAIGSLKSRKARIGENIGATKRDREEMFRLRDVGLNRRSAEAHVAEAQRLLSANRSIRRNIENARDQFREECPDNHHLSQLRNNLERVKAGRKEFEATFSRPEEKAKRRRQFEKEFHERLRWSS